ncbi:MAG: hypothetical protein ACO36E_08590, partial [Synechocystis sp.]
HQTQFFPPKVAGFGRGLLMGVMVMGLGGMDKAQADSPLTSTDLATAYADIPAVRAAQRYRRLDASLLTFLLGDRPLDEKAAVINGLGWRFEGTRHGEAFLQALAQQQGKPLANLSLKDLSPDHKFVLGYLLALDDYLYLSPLKLKTPTDLASVTPIQLLSQAAYALPDDFTVQFVRSLVVAQYWFAQYWCAVYLEPITVLRQFPPASRNLRPQAIDAAMKYMDLYQPDCRP